MQDPELQTFAGRLLLHRKRLGLSQDALSDKVGVAQDTISKWERGKASASVPELCRLCELFEVSADYLIGRTDQEDGLPTGMFLVDLDAAEDPHEGDDFAVQIPKRAKIMTHKQLREIYDAGVKNVKGRRKR